MGSTRVRLALVSTIVLAFALTVADVALLTSLGYTQQAESDALLVAQAGIVHAGIQDANGSVSLGGDTGQNAEGVAVDSAVIVNGTVVAASPGQPLSSAPLLAVAADARGSGSAFADAVDAHGIPRRLYATELDAGTVLVVSRSVAVLQGTLRQTAALLVIASLGLVVVAGAVSYWMAGRALRGVRESFESLRRFTADASHELRAPLALLRNELDVTLQRERSVAEYERSLTGMRTEVDHLTRLTDHLLLLARADASALIPAREAIDVADTLHEAAARWSRAASDAGVTFVVHAPDSGALRAEGPLLRRVIDNLADNALRYSPRGGTVTLSGARGDGGWWITVADEGTGVPEMHRARLFTRFARPDAARSRDDGGAGLGLALSAAILRAHGGRIELAPASRGATFRFFLPDVA